MQCINMYQHVDTPGSCVLWELFLRSTNEDLRAKQRKQCETREAEVSTVGRELLFASSSSSSVLMQTNKSPPCRLACVLICFLLWDLGLYR